MGRERPLSGAWFDRATRLPLACRPICFSEPAIQREETRCRPEPALCERLFNFSWFESRAHATGSKDSSGAILPAHKYDLS